MPNQKVLFIFPLDLVSSIQSRQTIIVVAKKYIYVTQLWLSNSGFICKWLCVNIASHFPHGIFCLETMKNSIGQMEQGIHANKSTLLSIIGKSKI